MTWVDYAREHYISVKNLQLCQSWSQTLPACAWSFSLTLPWTPTLWLSSHTNALLRTGAPKQSVYGSPLSYCLTMWKTKGQLCTGSRGPRMWLWQKERQSNTERVCRGVKQKVFLFSHQNKSHICSSHYSSQRRKIVGFEAETYCEAFIFSQSGAVKWN